MKTLTIKQPWAALIAHGLKPIENRTWATKYRGPLLIHVSARIPFTAKAWGQFCREHPVREGIEYQSLLDACGRIICKVDLIDCVPIASLPTSLQGHWTAEGPICWIIRNPVAFDGTPLVKGRLSIWDYDPDTIPA